MKVWVVGKGSEEAGMKDEGRKVKMREEGSLNG